MKSGVPWHVKGVRPQARETAREAARRSGMSVGEWLDTVIVDSALDRDAGPQPSTRGEPVPDDFGERDNNTWPAHREREERYPDHDVRPQRRNDAEYDDRQRLAGYAERPRADDQHRHPGRYFESRSHMAPPRPADSMDRVQPVVDQGFAALNHRLDSLTQQLDHLARLNATNAANARMSRSAVGDDDASRQLATVISKLDRRLDHLVADGRAAKHEIKHEIEQRGSVFDRPMADLPREQPRQAGPAGDPPTPLDQALMEIADRQRALDGHAPVAARAATGNGRASSTSEPLPRARTQEFAALERELRHINQEIETLKTPCGIDKAVDALRDDLAEIGVMLQDAMPRKAVEALEGELRRLSDRVEQTRHAGADGTALAGLERGLAEVRDALHALTPAENLVGFNEAVRTLSQKIDLLAGQNQDPAALKQLEGAILAMRGIVSHVASNDALAALSHDVRSLAAKIEQTTAGGGSDVISSLERRIGTLADALEARNRNGQNVPHELETVVKGLIDKIERIQLNHGDQAAVGHLEGRIAKLVEKLDASDARVGQLEAIERGLAELLIHLEHQRLPALARAGAETPSDVDALQRGLADLKQIDKKTQDTLEAVHGTLGLMVDRLAMIESDIREKGASTAPAKEPPQAPAVVAPAPAGPIAAAKPIAEIIAAKSAAADPQPKAASPAGLPPAPTLPAAMREPVEVAPPPAKPVPPQAAERRPIDPNLPPDHPLEPGSGTTRGRNSGSPADRIAASEAALGPARPPVIPDPGGKSDFIAAARRAAQAAAREAPVRTGLRAADGPAAVPSKIGRLANLWSKHRRALIVGASIVVIVAGMLQIVSTWLGSAPAPDGGAASETATSNSTAAAPVAAPAPPAANEPPAAPSTVPGRQSNLMPDTDSVPAVPPVSGVLVEPSGATAAAKPASPTGSADRGITGTIQPPAKSLPANPVPPAAPPAITTAVVPPTGPPVRTAPTQPDPPASTNGADKLPASFSVALRNAAIHDDPAAQYEVAVRFAEARGVPQNLPAAVEWFQRATNHGLVPAQFRLGGLYEKGLGVKKNLETARRLYLGAGEAGNAKALHNLAVLYAEGIDGKPDYQTAAKWFRKAASYGVADSQYNLGILYARGIGVEQNLAEAYRWFALAAHDGDREALKKRDDLAGRLDRQSLAAAQQAVESFRPEPQPVAATEVKVPSGGWDTHAAATPAGGKHKPHIVGPKLDLSTPRAGR